jgi:rod shape-determining protein MreC
MAPESDSPPLFLRGPGPGTRLFFFISICVALNFLDARFHWLEPVRSALSVAIWPLEQVARAPAVVVGGLSDFFTAHAYVVRENEALRRERIRLVTELERARGMVAENAHLRSLLGAQARQTQPTLMAEVMSVEHDPFSRRILVNRGTAHGVVDGAPVVDGHGVVGQVIRAMPLTSEVALVTDRDQPVPVEVERNHLRAVAFGEGGTGRMEVRFMPMSADIQPGDMLLTSGIDGIYPPGLPVARVLRVDRVASLAFPRILCVPAAGAENNRQVLIVLPMPAKAQQGKR